MNVFFFNRIPDTFTPHALGRTGLGKGQLESDGRRRADGAAFAASHGLTRARANGLTHTDNVNKLHCGVATFFHVNFENLTKDRKLIVQVTGQNVSHEVADVERPGGLGVVLVQIPITRSKI